MSETKPIQNAKDYYNYLICHYDEIEVEQLYKHLRENNWDMDNITSEILENNPITFTMLCNLTKKDSESTLTKNKYNLAYFDFENFDESVCEYDLKGRFDKKQFHKFLRANVDSKEEYQYLKDCVKNSLDAFDGFDSENVADELFDITTKSYNTFLDSLKLLNKLFIMSNKDSKDYDEIFNQIKNNFNTVLEYG